MATKSVKKAKKQTTLKKNIKLVKNTAESVNDQISETAEVIIEDVMKSGKKMTAEATKRAKDAIRNIDVNAGVEMIKQTAAEVNKYTLETAEELVDGALVHGKNWQGVAEKAVNGGLKLAEKQQDIVFDTLEVVKKQFVGGIKRFKKLVTK